MSQVYKDALNLTTGGLGKGGQLCLVTSMPGSAPGRGWGASRLQQPRSLRHQGLCHFPAQITHPPTLSPKSSPLAHSAVHIPCDSSAGIFPAGTGTDEQTERHTHTHTLKPHRVCCQPAQVFQRTLNSSCPRLSYPATPTDDVLTAPWRYQFQDSVPFTSTAMQQPLT